MVNKNTFVIGFLIIAVFTSASFAQTTINLEDFDYLFERDTKIYTYIDNSTTSVDIGTTGESSWDFSTGLSIDESYEYDVLSPAGTPFRPDYPNADVAFKYNFSTDNLENWEYYCRSANLVHLHGLVNASAAIEGQVTKYIYNPVKLFAYVPMTFNTTWRDTVVEKVVVETNGSVQAEDSFTVVTVSQVDAYGTIILPDSTTSEALRVKIMENKTGSTMNEEKLYFRWFAKTGETLIVEVDPALPDNGMIPVRNIKWTLKSEITTDVPVQTASLPSEYKLAQNYPNPFNPVTSIKYSVPEAAHVQLKVYNAIGKEVTTLVNERRSAGTYVASFNGDGLTSGIYFVKMTAGRFNEVIKMTLMK